MPKSVQVAIPRPFHFCFDYFLPENIEYSEDLIGSVVKVPFGNKDLYGIIWSISDVELDAKIKIKTVKNFVSLDGENNLQLKKSLLNLIKWVSEYYIAPLGSVLAMSLSVPDAFYLKNEVFLRVTEKTLEKITEKRQSILDAIKTNPKLSKKKLIKELSLSQNVLRNLIKDGIVEEFVQEKAKEIDKKFILSPKNISLNDEQKKVADFLKKEIEQKKYSATVLEGVTGSGKTETYFAAIETILAQGKQVLILLPEIVLTEQLVKRIENHFGFTPTLWHSSLTKKERKNNYSDIAVKNARLIVGARSAVFLPYADLGLIVVDEEHEASFKQEDGVRYHGRDTAVMLAFQKNIPIILASASPSLETYNNIFHKKYHHIHLSKRFKGATLPELQIVDMRKEGLKSDQFLSQDLKKALSVNLENKEQSLLFLNRRGYAPLMLCRKCGYRLSCPSCSAWLVKHTRSGKLQCHHCGYSSMIEKECPSCGAEDSFVACGPGVERIAEEVKKFLPQANVVIFTSDYVNNPKKTSEIVAQIHDNQVDIIIGTQMIVKGHHFPNLTLVGVIDADMGMDGGDIRAGERSFQILQQVSGRAGRENKRGKAIIQTYLPESEIFNDFQKNDYLAFIEGEIERREHAFLPPFSHMASLIITSVDEELANNFAKKITKLALPNKDIRILGPAPAPLYMLKNNYRFRILLIAKRQVEQFKNIQNYINHLLKHAKVPNKVTVKVDVDPQSFM